MLYVHRTCTPHGCAPVKVVVSAVAGPSQRRCTRACVEVTSIRTQYLADAAAAGGRAAGRDTASLASDTARARGVAREVSRVILRRT